MKLVINEPPIPQSRPRFNSRNKRAYEKSNIKSYKQRVGYIARKEFKKPLERDTPLEINMKFYMPIPQYLLVKLSVEKVYSFNPRTEIEIRELEIVKGS